MEQIEIVELLPEPAPKFRFYLLTAVLTVDGGLAFGGFEWHEKYVAKLTIHEKGQRQLLESLMTARTDFGRGVIVETGGGPRIKIGNTMVFVAMTEIRPNTAKELLEQKILSLLNFAATSEVAA